MEKFLFPNSLLQLLARFWCLWYLNWIEFNWIEFLSLSMTTRPRFPLGTYYMHSLYHHSVGTNGETEREREGESHSQKDRKTEREKQDITTREETAAFYNLVIKVKFHLLLYLRLDSMSLCSAQTRESLQKRKCCRTWESSRNVLETRFVIRWGSVKKNGNFDRALQ